MTLKVEHIGGFNVFDWEAFHCPLCNGKQFVSHDHSAIWCDDCNAKFQTRDTAGDPGVVVDCWIADRENAYVYAPSYKCSECDVSRGLFDWQDKTCPCNMNHQMTRVERQSQRWIVPDDMKDKDTGTSRFCLVLKTGDYCSGWMKGWGGMSHHGKTPTQKEWDAFQYVIEQERELSRMMNQFVLVDPE